MKEAKRKRLERAGWKVTTVAEFLGLSEAEERLIDTHIALSDALRRRRQDAHLTQTALARRLRTSQSRVAKMEAGDPSVSLDLLVRALFVLGASRRQVGEAISAGVA